MREQSFQRQLIGPQHVSMIKSMVFQLDLSSSHPYQSVVLSAQGVKVSPGLEAKGLSRVNPIFHKYYLWMIVGVIKH